MLNSRWMKFGLAFLGVLLAVGLAAGTRWQAVRHLPVDYDEDDYLLGAQQYAALIRAGDWAGFMETNYRPEHPPLAKILYALAILPAPEAPLLADRSTTSPPNQYLPVQQKLNARKLAALFGVLEVALLALVNPLAGLFLGIHTWTIKYTSQIMLEAFPSLTSLAVILCYLRWKRLRPSGGLRGWPQARALVPGRRQAGWLVASAVFLGLTAASKYLYCIVGVAIIIDWVITSNQNEEFRRGSIRSFLAPFLLWGGLAFLVFFMADPYLWPDPLVRLKESVFYHAGYSSTAAEVEQANFPFWQPFNWFSMSVPWHQGQQVFYVTLDPWITLLAIFGLGRLWKKERLYVLWLAVGIVFLLLWPTKWPQYVLVMTAPLALAAVKGVWALFVEPVRGWLARRREPKVELRARSQLPRALPWLIPGLLAFGLLVVYPLFYQSAMAVTDFNGISIRDGINGGVWRAAWQGITGQEEATDPDIPFRAKEVHFTGLHSFPPIFEVITSWGILVFDSMWMFFSVALQTVLGVGLALLLWQNGIRFRRAWTALFILPWAIPEMIGAIMWLNVVEPTTGWLALAVKDLGPQIPFAWVLDWVNDPNKYLLVMLTAGMWYGFPLILLAASAGLTTVPSDVLDAAAIDGAGSWGTFRHVIWPLLVPLLVPAIIIRGIFAFNQFYLFQMFFDPTATLAVFSYNLFNPAGFLSANGQPMNAQFSLSAALNILTLLILIGFVAVFNRWTKAGEGVTYA
jgi:ABC-type sugar transport system permease subunit